ncbi:unnamed protein product [Pedinophyceae sp. YPF-701]|nr:unnamed protein product [Pedinophyceae sp. YPF-701]
MPNKAAPGAEMVPGARVVMETAAKYVVGDGQSGIDLVLGNPGTTELHLTSALDHVDGLRSTLVLHETVAAGAADGYARMLGRPAMVLLHLGPGLANAASNLHNAKRARSPVLAVVGDMATWHADADAPLASDIEGLARTFAGSVRTATSPASLESDTQEAILATHASADAAESPTASSRVSVLIVPHDLSWTQVPRTVAQAAQHRHAAPRDAGLNGSLSDTSRAAFASFAKQLAEKLRQHGKGQSAFYLGGRALVDGRFSPPEGRGGLLFDIGRCAAAVGAAVICENSFARVDRGAGRPALQRLPYFPQDAKAELDKYAVVVLFDVRRPVAMFGYEGGPSELLPDADGDRVWEIDDDGPGLDAFVAALTAELAADAITPGRNCGGLFAGTAIPRVPKDGQLDAASLCAVVAALQPEGCIVVDESLTSGAAYWEASRRCSPFSHLTLTGGSIGCGPPLAVGAALACPHRPVINIQADGSAMYSLQALWTQAREKLHVVTVVCNNARYNILRIEMAKQRIGAPGPACRGLLDLDSPGINFVSLAQGMGVPAARVTTVAELASELREGLAGSGPRVIDAVLP